MLRVFLTLCVSVALFAGCEVDNPDDVPGIGSEADAGPEGEERDSDRDDERSQETQSLTLTVEPVPGITHYNSVPIYVHGPANATLLYESDVDGQQSRQLSTDGRVCVDVALDPGTNRLRFQVGRDGRYSNIVSRDIEREERLVTQTPTPEVTAPAARNIARGSRSISHNLSIDSGSVAAVVDGDERNAHVRLANAAFEDDWLRIGLTERAHVQQVRLVGTGDCAPKSYSVFLSDSERPPAPSMASSAWDAIGSVSLASGDDTVTDSQNRFARWVGFRFETPGCGPAIGVGRNEIVEIQVFTLDQLPQVQLPTQTDNGTPTCANGRRP